MVLVCAHCSGGEWGGGGLMDGLNTVMAHKCNGSIKIPSEGNRMLLFITIMWKVITKLSLQKDEDKSAAASCASSRYTAESIHARLNPVSVTAVLLSKQRFHYIKYSMT